MLGLGLECCDSFLWGYESLGFGSNLKLWGLVLLALKFGSRYRA